MNGYQDIYEIGTQKTHSIVANEGDKSIVGKLKTETRNSGTEPRGVFLNERETSETVFCGRCPWRGKRESYNKQAKLQTKMRIWTALNWIAVTIKSCYR
jgi:hypothetical protein